MLKMLTGLLILIPSIVFATEYCPSEVVVTSTGATCSYTNNSQAEWITSCQAVDTNEEGTYVFAAVSANRYATCTYFNDNDHALYITSKNRLKEDGWVVKCHTSAPQCPLVSATSSKANSSAPKS